MNWTHWFCQRWFPHRIRLAILNNVKYERGESNFLTTSFAKDVSTLSLTAGSFTEAADVLS